MRLCLTHFDRIFYIKYLMKVTFSLIRNRNLVMICFNFKEEITGASLIYYIKTIMERFLSDSVWGVFYVSPTVASILKFTARKFCRRSSIRKSSPLSVKPRKPAGNGRVVPNGEVVVPVILQFYVTRVMTLLIYF